MGTASLVDRSTTTVTPNTAATSRPSFVRWLRDVSRADIPTVGGKGANLGELTRAGFPVPPGFVIPVEAYWRFREESGLGAVLDKRLQDIAVDDTAALQQLSTTLREMIETAPIPADLASRITEAYAALCFQRSMTDAFVAVRSSATAEDTGQFSFAGMFESFLNIHGRAALLHSVKQCWASTFHARVLFYRLKQGLPAEMPVAVVVQAMAGGDKAGVVFTVDPASRDASRIVIEAAWGLGETVVLGQVTPDRYVLAKDTLAIVEEAIAEKEFLLARDPVSGATARIELTDDPRRTRRVLSRAELHEIGEIVRRVETHYAAPQDIEFAIEGDSLWLTQARPITTLGSPVSATPRTESSDTPIVHGLGASPGRVVGRARVLASPADAGLLQPGEVLVTRMTSPDWVPVMRRASAVVTDAGGMTSHAAIVSRELGIPCIVGTKDGSTRLVTGALVAVDGAHGTVTAAADAPAAFGPSTDPPLTAVPTRQRVESHPVTATRLYVNLGEPDRADEIAQMDVDGVGLLRAEFLLLSALERVHPRKLIASGRGDQIASRMADGLRIFARAFAPRPVIYRAIDFRSNEFRGLDGGQEFEPAEENPMIGYRGCFRYVKEPELFGLELKALAEVRREFPNVHLMIPFVRTAWELRECKRLIDGSALAGDRSLELWVMAEVPSVVYRLPEYVRAGVTGLSIGSNDLTQLVLGVDRDSEAVAPLFDERDGAVQHTIRQIIAQSHRAGITCSICGQAPSVYPEYAERLVRWGIDSISVNPDVIDRTRRNVAAAEQRLLVDSARARVARDHRRRSGPPADPASSS